MERPPQQVDNTSVAPARAWGAGRRLLVLVGGVLLVVAGVALLVLPGPGVLLVFAGLALLATEFPAARRAQRWLTRKARRTYGRLFHGRDVRPPPSDVVRGGPLGPPPM